MTGSVQFAYLMEAADLHLSLVEGERDLFSNDLISTVHVRSYHD